MVDSATIINRSMPKHICETVSKLAKERRNISILGVAFKGDTDDTRFTPAYEIYDYFKEKKFNVTISDPFVKDEKIRIDHDIFSASGGANIILVLTDHSEYKSIDLKKLKEIMDKNPLIFDTRGIINRDKATKVGFEYHGLGRL